MRMKPILQNTTICRKVKAASKRRVRFVKHPCEDKRNVRMNDPLAIGIEELGRAFWPLHHGSCLSEKYYEYSETLESIKRHRNLPA